MGANNPKILIIDDEKTICDASAQILGEDGCQVETSFEGLAGLKKVDDFKPDVVLVDLKMPGISGIEVLEKISKKDKNIVSVVITGYATIESAVESMKKGAYDFLSKPFNPDELRIICKRALERRRILLETERLKREKDKMRQNFVALVSHELRTPLVAVMQYLEVFTGGVAGEISQEQAKIVNRMKIRLNELLGLIDRWLKLSRIEELKLEESFEDFILSTVINDTIDLVKPFAQEKKVNIEVKSMSNNIIINGDIEMIKEVFTNIINNGIKYNREGGKVMVESREQDNFWVVDISDTGIGVPEQEIAHMGDEFYRVKREGSAAGSGLGLAIVKKILDIHNGKLEIKSRYDQGSTFSIFLPRTSTKTGKHS